MLVRYACQDELTHYGIKGQKWGVRRYQNSDGSLTDAGRKRYARQIQKIINKPYPQEYRDKQFLKTDATKSILNSSSYKQIQSDWNKTKEESEKMMADYHKNNKKWVTEACGDYYSKIYNMDKKEAIDEYKDFWLYEDGDQGQSKAYYLDKTGQRQKYEKLNKARQTYTDSLHTLIKDAGYFDMPLKGSRYGMTPYNDSVGGVVEDVISHEDKWWAIPSAYFYMDNNK